MNAFNAGTYKKILLSAVLALLVLAVITPLALKKYLTTPPAAARISRLLSDTLGQPVVVKSAELSGATLQLKGLAVVNPPGFPTPNLLTIDSLALKPVWFTLLSDSRVIDTIALDGITLDLRRSSAGVWNFDGLQRRLSASKPSSAEVLIRQLIISNGAVQIDDHRLAGLALKVANLANRGAEKSGFQLEFDDPSHNHYRLSGRGRLGTDPELELALSSASIALKSISGLLKIKNGYLPDQGDAALQLTAELRKGIIQSQGRMTFTGVGMAAAGKGQLFSGNLALSASYDSHKDDLTVDRLTLLLDRLLTVRASGSVQQLKKARNFAVDLATDEVDLAKIAPLIPELGRRKITLGGRLDKSALHLSGSARDGISAARGDLRLALGMMKQGQQLFFKDLMATAALSGSGDAVTISGKALQGQAQAGALLEALDAPYNITLNRQLALLKAESPALSARAGGLSYSGKTTYAAGAVLVENGTLTGKDLALTIGRLSARMPLKQVGRGASRYPLQADFSGADLKRGEIRLNNLSGSIRGAYAMAPQAKWLEGSADLKAEKVAWQEKEAGSTGVKARFSEAGCSADFTTSLLGGTAAGNARFNPFALQERVDFTVKAQGIPLAGIINYAGVRSDVAITGGVLEGSVSGSFSSSAGLACHIEAQGSAISLTNKAKKSILSDGGIRINTDLAGRKLVINDSLLTVGKDLAVKAVGALENAFQSERQGQIAFSVPNTSLNAVADAFINLLPRSLQEATLGGGLAAEGTLNLLKGSLLIAGAATLTAATIEAPAENVSLNAINGLLPFAFDLNGTSAAKQPSYPTFNRQNYAALLKQLRQNPEKGAALTVGKASFGGLSLDSLTLRLRSGQGITEIVSLDASLYDGALSGKGFITAQNGILYRGDLLINDLSLVQLCKAFPAIAGYLSGRVDGIVSIQGRGQKLSDLDGFSEFWARGTKSEKMLVSKEFLQRLSGKKLSGFFFSTDRPYDRAGIKAVLEKGFLTFDSLDISNTNALGVRDLSVTIAPGQNRIAIDHLLNSIKEATLRGKSSSGSGEGADIGAPAAAPLETEFKWVE